MLVPILDEVIGEAARGGHRIDPDRHGAPRPAQRDGARAVQAVRADPGGVQGSRLVAQLPRGHGVDGGREVSRRRPSRDPGRPRDEPRDLDAAQPEPPGGDRPDRRRDGARGRHLRGRRRRAAFRSVAQPPDPDPRRRGVPRPGDRRGNAEPEPPARLRHGRHDPHHRQQPARVHGRHPRVVQHVVRERARARLQDPDRPRQRRRSGRLRRSGAAGDGVLREIPSRLPDRSDRLSPLGPQRGGRAGVHAAGDVPEDRVAPDGPRDLGGHAGRARRRRRPRRPTR